MNRKDGEDEKSLPEPLFNAFRTVLPYGKAGSVQVLSGSKGSKIAIAGYQGE